MAKYLYLYGSGFAQVKMKDGDKPLFMVPLVNKIAKRFSAFGLMIKDMELVLEALNQLKSGKLDQLHKQSLSFFAIVTYAKCYTEAHGRGSQLQDKDALQFASAEAKTEHARIMEQRHNYVAHGGLKGYEENAIVAYVDPETEKIVLIEPNIVYLVDIDSQLDNFISLAKTVLQYLHIGTQETFIKLESDTYERTFDDLMKDAILPDIDKSIEW